MSHQTSEYALEQHEISIQIKLFLYLSTSFVTVVLMYLFTHKTRMNKGVKTIYCLTCERVTSKILINEIRLIRGRYLSLNYTTLFALAPNQKLPTFRVGRVKSIFSRDRFSFKCCDKAGSLPP